MSKNRNIAIIAAGAAVIVGLMAFNSSSKRTTEESVVTAAAATTEPSQAQAASPVEPATQPLPEMALGDPHAPVTIIEYSSLSCPHCAAFHKDVLPSLKSQYVDTGKVRYVVREFPLNDAALAGAVIGRCLDPSKYFAFIDLLFSKQEDWAFKDDAYGPLKQFAKQAGLPDSEFEKCLENEDMQKRILAVRDQGSKDGVNGTPSFFINGKLFKGAPTLEALSGALKPYLNPQQG